MIQPPSKSGTVIKVHGGTPRSDSKNLCHSCWNSTVIRGDRGEELIKCSDAGRLIEFKVVDCNAYSDRSKTPLGELYKAAWILAPDEQKKNVVGFMPYKEWAKKNPKEYHSHY